MTVTKEKRLQGCRNADCLSDHLREVVGLSIGQVSKLMQSLEDEKLEFSTNTTETKLEDGEA